MRLFPIEPHCSFRSVYRRGTTQLGSVLILVRLTLTFERKQGKNILVFFLFFLESKVRPIMQVSTFTSEEFFEKFSNSVSLQNSSLLVNAMQPAMIGLAVAYGTLFVLGVLANFWTALVIGCVLLERDNEAPRNVQIYIFALCVSDLIILSSLLLLLSDVISGYWIVGSTYLCYMYLFSETLNKFFGPFLLSALSGTCCVSVCLPSKRPAAKDTAVACSVVGFCAVLAVALTTPVYLYGDVYYLVVHNGSDYDFYLPKCMFQPPETVFNVFTAYSFIMGYAVPAFMFTLFYTAVLCFVHRHSRTVTFDNSLYFWKVAKTALTLVVFYLSCWTPYWIMSLYNYFTPLSDTSGSNIVTYLSYLVHLLPYINCAGYPILYTLLNRNIKKAYQRVKQRRRNNSPLYKLVRRFFPALVHSSKRSKPSRACSSTTLNSTLIVTYNGSVANGVEPQVRKKSLSNPTTFQTFRGRSSSASAMMKKRLSIPFVKPTGAECTTFDRTLWKDGKDNNN